MSSALTELLRRHDLATKSELKDQVQYCPGEGDRFLRPLFPQQLSLAQDTNPLREASCGRRGGKSTFVGAMFAKRGFEYRNSLQLFYAPTKDDAVRIIWPKLKNFNEDFECGWEFRETTKHVIFPNKSEIHLLGADSYADINKARGTSPVTVILDEAGFYGRHFQEMIESVIMPSLSDYNGHLILLSSPTRPIGYYYEQVVCNPVWSHHTWRTIDNPYLPLWAGKPDAEEIKQKFLEDRARKLGVTVDHPKIRRDYGGEWVQDLSTQFYKYDPSLNDIHEFPNLTVNDWKLFICVDPGWRATAVTVGGYNDFDDKVYFCSSKKYEHLLTDQLGAVITKLWNSDQYSGLIKRVIVDQGALGKTIAEDLRVRTGLPVVAATKRDKLAHQETMNSDFMAGRIKLYRPGCEDYAEELMSLEAAEDQQGPDPDGEDHNCDTGLYLWRQCRHMQRRLESPKDTRTSEEIWEKEVWNDKPQLNAGSRRKNFESVWRRSKDERLHRSVDGATLARRYGRRT